MKGSRSWPTWCSAMSSKPSAANSCSHATCRLQVSARRAPSAPRRRAARSAAATSNGLGRLEVPADRRVEDVRAPLVVRDRAAPPRRSAPTTGAPAGPCVPPPPECVEHRAGACSTGALTVASPSAHSPPQRAVASLDRRAQQRRRCRPAASTAVRGRRRRRPSWRDLLAGEQRPHHVHALAQPRGPHVLRRPALARDVLVGGFAGPERDPQPLGEHLGQRRGRLGDDRGVVALSRRVDDAERQRGRGERGAEERPGEARTRPGARSRARSGPRTCRRRSRPPRRDGSSAAGGSAGSARASSAGRSGARGSHLPITPGANLGA